MDVKKILEELRSELADINRAIISIERLGGKRRGRPPKGMSATTQTKPRKKRVIDPAKTD